MRLKNNLAKFFLYASAATAWVLSGVSAQAAEMASGKTQCYLMQGDKVARKGTCTVNVGYGAGYEYTIVKMGKKTYSYEHPIGDVENASYSRVQSTMKKVRSNDDLQKPLVFCMKDKPYHVCFAGPSS